MSWHVMAAGKKIVVQERLLKDKYFVEHAPIGVQKSFESALGYFPDEAKITAQCNGHIDSAGGNIEIKISMIPGWLE